jgi:hypothetical protein
MIEPRGYVAPVPQVYGGQCLQRGEIIKELRGYPNDRLLVEMNLLRPLTAEDMKHAAKCDDCGRVFIDASYRDVHRRYQLCNASTDRIMNQTGAGDREVIANLPEARRSEIKDLGYSGTTPSAVEGVAPDELVAPPLNEM